MNRLYPLILAALLLVGATTATAQSVTISGTVTEANSGEAITGATVALFRESDSGSAKPVRGGISNRFGFYSIPKVAPGRYRLVARSIGSEQRAQSILIPESGVPTLVETEARRYHRRRHHRNRMPHELQCRQQQPTAEHLLAAKGVYGARSCGDRSPLRCHHQPPHC